MSSWPPNESLRPVSLDLLGSLTPIEVLYEFEGPCIFTARTPSDALVLAYLSEELEAEDLLRFIVATTSESTVAALKEGMVSVRDALERGSLWRVDVDRHHQPQHAYAVRADQLPEDALPLATTMLWAKLEPALVVRLEGPEVIPGQIPAGVFAQAGEIASKALKPIFEWAARSLRHETNGRPPDWLRLLYGLPAQRFAYGSLEVAFRSVDLSQAQASLPFDAEAPTPEAIQTVGWQALREGLDWTISDETLPTGEGDDEKWLAILEAMNRLAPSLAGPVKSIELSGSLIGRVEVPFHLDRQSTRRIRSSLTQLKKRHEVQLRVFTGLIRELDLDKLTMIMRETGQPGDIQLVLDDDTLLETVREANYHELEVSVSARTTDTRNWTAVDVEFVQRQTKQTADQ